MTVSDLIKKLAEYPGELPIFAEWEGVLAMVHPDNFTVREECKGRIGNNTECLIIDVEDY